jgi:unsaturated rhamnogalacturonyl hydrolase
MPKVRCGNDPAVCALVAGAFLAALSTAAAPEPGGGVYEKSAEIGVVAQLSRTVGEASVLESRKAKEPSDQRLARSFAPPNCATSEISGGLTTAAARPLDWSIRMADSELERLGDRLAWKPGGRAKWDYTTGLFTFTLLQLHERVKEARYLQFAKDTVGSFITADGRISGYNSEDYSLDNINPGRTLLELYRMTKELRYKEVAGLLRRQLAAQPRTSEGGFWHKKRYPDQMWLDGLYMAAPFYAEYAALFQEPASTFDDVAKQIRLVAKHTYDPGTGLFFHGWDEKKQQDWASKTTGTSSNFWGRAIGWYGMALVDVLDWMPTNNPARPEIIGTLRKLCAGILKYQDPESGIWYQIVDQGGRQGNYLEASASCMFVYVLAKSLNHRYLTRDVEPAVLKGYNGIITRLIREDKERQVSLTQCCSVAGLGYGRDGSYEYYIKEPIGDNDLKGVGPFILAGLEVHRLLGLPDPAPAGGQ